MSITGFEDAISDNVKSYSNNLEMLRNTNVMARNNALAGLASEVEKYSEMAKLGLEIPVAVESLKAVGGRAVDLANFVKGVPSKFNEARGVINAAIAQGRDTIQSGVSQARGYGEMAQSQAKNAISNARGAASNIKNQVMSQGEERLDNLRVTSSRMAGESKMDFNPTERVRENMMLGKTDDPGMEMTATDDPNYFETKSGGSSFAYGDGARDATNSDAAGESKFEGFEPDEDEYGLPKATEPVGTGEPSLFSHEEPRFSTSRGLDADFEDRGIGVGNLGRPPYQERQTFSQHSTTAPEAQRGAGEGIELGETKTGGSSLVRQSSQGYNEIDRTEASGYDDSISNATKQTVGTEASSVADDALGAGDVVDSAAAAGAGEAAGAVEEAAGAGLLASGIFAPIGALLEGLGAVTEVGSVAAGAYGAVKSFSEQGVEEALRNKAMPTVSAPRLDLGGRVAAPILA